MQRALELAKKGRYSTKPNPAVGCVLVKNGEVIAEGWHLKAGMPHAERVALASAQQQGVDVAGATAYVTLEPCSHYGRTPPCAEGLVEAKIARCVVAMRDPNPLVAGRGLQMLEAAGIEVCSGLLEAEAEELNRAFLFAMCHQRPYVRLKMASSLDGKTAMANGESQWITGPQSRQEVHKLRAESGAILTGVGTVLADDPSLTVRLPESVLQSLHLSSEDGYPLRVVLDSQLKMLGQQPAPQMFNLSGKTLIFCAQEALEHFAQEIQAFHSSSVQFYAVQTVTGRLDLKQILQILFTEFAINSVLVEAGQVLAGSFIKQGLVEEVHSYLAPCLMGSEARGLFDLGQMSTMRDKICFTIADVQRFGEDIRLILRPEASPANSQQNP